MIHMYEKERERPRDGKGGGEKKEKKKKERNLQKRAIFLRDEKIFSPMPKKCDKEDQC